MESKKIFFYGALLFLVSLLGAQEYYVDQTDGETRFVQRLVWQADKNASRYEVVIEKLLRENKPLWGGSLPESGESLVDAGLPENDEVSGSDVVSGEDETFGEDETPGADTSEPAVPVSTEPSIPGSSASTVGTEPREDRGIYTRVLRESTGDAYIEVSLPPGIYRYQVTAYDFLDRPGAPSEWARITILEALEPALDDFSPRVFYVDVDGPWVLNLTGSNISPDAEIYLESEKNRVIAPREVAGDESLAGAELVFDIKKLVPGSYEIHIKNPGGLNTSAGTFEIGFYKSYDMFIGAAYTPLIPLYGNLGEMEKKPIFPLGAAARFGIFPFKKSYGHFGVELSAVWNYLSSGSGDDKVSYHVAGGEVNLLYQKWLPNRVMALTIRAGGGLAGTTGMLLPRVEAGASFLWLIHKPFYIEAGVDVVHWFTGGNPGYLRPWLGGGVKL